MIKISNNGRSGERLFHLIDQESLYVSKVDISNVESFAEDNIHLNERGGYMYYRAYYYNVLNQINTVEY